MEQQHYDGVVVEEEDGMFSVDVGDGERDLSNVDEQVALLARAIFHMVSPVTPAEVYRWVVDGVADGSKLARENECHRVKHKRQKLDTARGKPHLLRMAMLPANLLQFCEPTMASLPRPSRVFGHPVVSLRFATREDARLAVATYTSHRAATADDVLQYMCRVRCCNPRLNVTHFVDGTHLPPLAVATDLPNDEEGAITTGQWNRLVQAVEEQEKVGSATRLPLLVDGRRAISMGTVVHAHWRVHHGASLVHRTLPDCELHPIPLGSGLLVEMHFPAFLELHQLPWFVSPEHRYVSLGRLAGIKKAGTAAEALPPWEDGVCDAVPCDAGVRMVVDGWQKSASQVWTHAPCLTGLAPLLLATDGVLETEDGTLRAMRGALDGDTLDPHAAAAQHIFENEWGGKYAREVMTRMTMVGVSGAVYAVYDTTTGDGDAVGAFAVIAFRCKFFDRGEGLAFLIDSFAVRGGKGKAGKRNVQGNGIGGRIYRELFLTALAYVHSPRGVVFAQCVRGGRARTFWVDKLDESRDARYLMWKAFVLCPEGVAVQDDSICGPRVREWSHTA